ncbi:MAG: hypothetical protein ACYTFG_05315 [Planctomycetota bacterium]|jgi:hypothetical protein
MMKTPEILGLSLVLALIFPTLLIAEEGEEPGPKEPERPERREKRERRPNPEKFFKQMVKELGLDEEQARQFKEIVKESQQTMQEAMKKANEDRMARIREILTEDQAAKFEKLSQRGRGRGRPGRIGEEGRQNRVGGPAGDLLRVLLRELDLNPGQREKVIEIVRDAQVRIDELLRDVREGGADPEALREKVQAIQTDLLEKVEPILSPDQATKLEELRRKIGKKLKGQFGRGARDRQGRPGQGGSSEEMVKKRLQAIRKDLHVEIPEVWAVLGEKIEKILRLQADFRTKLRGKTKALRELMKGESEEELLQKELDGLREIRKSHEEALEEMREDLRELLNLQEEAKLVMHGILD